MAKLNQRQLLIIAASVVTLIIVAVIVWLLYFQSDSTDPTNTNTATNTNVAVVNATVTNTATLTPDPAPLTPELEVTRVANFFTERYGSYSTDADYQNITDLNEYMTAKMKQSADDFIKVQRALNTSSTFSAIVTDVLSTNLEELGGDQATVRITTQRTESGDAFDQNNVYYQDIVLKMVSEDDEWIIDQATWQEPGVNTQIVDEEDATEDNGITAPPLNEILEAQE